MSVKKECYVIDMMHQKHTKMKENIKSVIFVRQIYIDFTCKEAVKMFQSVPEFGREVVVDERCDTFYCFCYKVFISKVHINEKTIYEL